MGSSNCFRWAVVILCCSSLTHGHLEREHSPMILPSENPLILHKDGLLHLTCRGHGPLQWKLVDSNRSLSSEEVKVESCDSRHHSHSHCSKLTITSLVANDTGRYNCEYSKNGSAHFTSIYVYVQDPEQPFVDPHPLRPIILESYRHETSLILPCRTTYPDIEVTLTGQLVALPEKVVKEQIWDPKVGFKIPYDPYREISMVFCKTKVNGRDFESKYFPMRITHALQNVKITPERVKLLVGDTLILNCTGKTTHNGRIKFTWDFPKSKENRHETQWTMDRSTKVYVMSRSLFLPNITMEDKGVYHCRAEINPTIYMNVTAKVIVIEHPYLNISYKHERHSTIRVKEGRKKLVFDPKVQALPPPDMAAWFKDGVPINRSSTCYKMSGFTLIIVNVQQQNAGVFTVSLGNQARGLHRNLSFTLIVEVKPIISEAELATVDVQPYMIGRQHQLTCTAYGVPLPNTTWFWQPCQLNTTLIKSPVHTDDRGNYSHNWIKSINVKRELVKGKIKVCV
ncbi:vascular endothelial growth factor receptor kdr-like [Notothenia coriiceps]|uniref:Platelet-derived growth factor receptor-like protein n=1 Tax=Notothenia coriiceps TaxID=8208 RepID=A0A6I9P243_9TELE|nr:PREDICTED: vascular endothelial growth factor receptor kdr-like [Notothenia coriiceps]